MFFKNLTMFRFPTTLDLSALDERLRGVARLFSTLEAALKISRA